MSVDKKPEKTPHAVLERDAKIQAALEGKPIKRKAAMPVRIENKEPDMEEELTDATQDVSLSEPKSQINMSYDDLKSQVADFYSRIPKERILIETEVMDFEIYASMVTLTDHIIWFLVSDQGQGLRPKVAGQYNIRYRDTVYKTAFAGTIIQHEELPFTILSFLLRDEE